MTVMMYFGFTDDILGLSPWLRIIVEIIMVGFVIKMDMVNMNDMHGLFGIHKLPVWLSLPLSAVAGVGIINSINMIDGVDGLSSGFCVVACLSFGFFSACLMTVRWPSCVRLLRVRSYLFSCTMCLVPNRRCSLAIVVQ